MFHTFHPESSAVNLFVFNPATDVGDLLYIQWKSSSAYYKFSNVPRHYMEAILDGDSAGQLAAEIKQKYPCEQVSETDVPNLQSHCAHQDNEFLPGISRLACFNSQTEGFGGYA